MAHVPQTIGRYRVEKQLGTGASGSVFLVTDPMIGRQAALKLLTGRINPQRIQREVQVLAALEHPNVVKIFDAGVHEGHPFFVMEYAGERSLEEAGLGLRETVEVLEQVARACHVAHGQGIVHRDLKPANILLGERPMVADFGIAKLTDAEKRITRTGAVLGTPAYMAPEQVGAEETIGPRTDVYALGVILYEAACGQLPFDGSNFLQLAAAIANGEAPAPREIEPAVPRELELIIQRAMASAPANRYPSAEAFADDLRAWLDGGSELADRLGRVAPAVLVIGAPLAVLCMACGILGGAKKDPQVGAIDSEPPIADSASPPRDQTPQRDPAPPPQDPPSTSPPPADPAPALPALTQPFGELGLGSEAAKLLKDVAEWERGPTGVASQLKASRLGARAVGLIESGPPPSDGQAAAWALTRIHFALDQQAQAAFMLDKGLALSGPFRGELELLRAELHWSRSMRETLLASLELVVRGKNQARQSARRALEAGLSEPWRRTKAEALVALAEVSSVEEAMAVSKRFQGRLKDWPPHEGGLFSAYVALASKDPRGALVALKGATTQAVTRQRALQATCLASLSAGQQDPQGEYTGGQGFWSAFEAAAQAAESSPTGTGGYLLLNHLGRLLIGRILRRPAVKQGLRDVAAGVRKAGLEGKSQPALLAAQAMLDAAADRSDAVLLESAKQIRSAYSQATLPEVQRAVLVAYTAILLLKQALTGDVLPELEWAVSEVGSLLPADSGLLKYFQERLTRHR